MTLNQWAGYTLTLAAKVSGAALIVLNMPVASSTASSGGLFTLTIGPNAASVQLPDLTTLLAVGDWVVFWPSDGRELWLRDAKSKGEGVTCRKVHWSSIVMRVSDPRVVH